jgi:hypothetical protein
MHKVSLWLVCQWHNSVLLSPDQLRAGLPAASTAVQFLTSLQDGWCLWCIRVHHDPLCSIQ